MEKKEEKIERPGFKNIIKRLWPFLLGAAIGPFTWSAVWLGINLRVVSDIFWGDGKLHAQELGLLTGVIQFVSAFSGLFYGYVADRYHRIKVLAITTIYNGIGIILYGFTPSGLGMTSYLIFLIIAIQMVMICGHGPVESSFMTDATEEDERSQLIGIRSLITQLSTIIGMIIAAFVFQFYWRQYFWITGGIIVIAGIAKGVVVPEPKRGAKKQELREILKMEEVRYKYKLTKETLKATILSRTNSIIIFEGMLSQVVQSIPFFLLLAFLTGPPYNLSPVVLSVISIIFGLPGALTGAMGFAKLSDRLGKKNIKNRVYFIFSSLTYTYLVYVVAMFLPLPHLTLAEGSNFLVVMSQPIIWVFGILSFSAQMVSGLFAINQQPLIQKMNLPEAQGAISSFNGFLEAISRGFGYTLASFILGLFNQNYRATVVTIMVIGMIGVSMWLFSLKWIESDLVKISDLLKSRAKELESQKVNDKNGK